MLVLGLGRTPEEFYYVFLREFPIVFQIFFTIVFALTFFFMTLFVRSLLKTRLEFPHLDMIINILNVAKVFAYFIIFFGYAMFNPSEYKVFTAMGNLHDLITAGLLLSILIAFSLTIFRTRKLKGALILAVSPAFFLWSIGFIIWEIYNDNNQVISLPSFIIWVYQSWNIIESLCLTWLAFCFCWILLQRFREIQKQMANQALLAQREKAQIIERQKEELERTVETRTAELKQSLNDLQNTQTQLIQSEKMASLGELMAGIAHEIQNPLNFVNNFSEINAELMQEMEQEIKSGNTSDALALADTIRQNIDKVNDHGKRADSIVKSMLQHSRSSSGQKELVNINSLAEEYLRLSYLGLRGKDRFFHATLTTDFDREIGMIKLIPQDISRVLVNLYNNAFYAVKEKEKHSPNGYEPNVSVTTKKTNALIEITVKDNGNGIPENIRQKIFQPFFTTKPTGQGTGLGLSLSYDIVKAHGGEIKLHSEVGKGSEFIICLPDV
jgi:signal transduction histidine kinase